MSDRLSANMTFNHVLMFATPTDIARIPILRPQTLYAPLRMLPAKLLVLRRSDSGALESYGTESGAGRRSLKTRRRDFSSRIELKCFKLLESVEHVTSSFSSSTIV